MLKRIILSAMLIAASATTFADEQVVKLYTDNDQSAPLSKVSFFLAADNDTQFQVILNDGTALLNVTKVQFSTSGTSSVVARNDLKAFTVAQSLHIDGCRQGDHISIFDMAGNTVATTIATASSQTISVSSLQPGLYILRVADNSVKFHKK
ncbi:MAG: T9SS type A sorting domain-containing protein [Muribaculaceae bacterium]